MKILKNPNFFNIKVTELFASWVKVDLELSWAIIIDENTSPNAQLNSPHNRLHKWQNIEKRGEARISPNWRVILSSPRRWDSWWRTKADICYFYTRRYDPFPYIRVQWVVRCISRYTGDILTFLEYTEITNWSWYIYACREVIASKADYLLYVYAVHKYLVCTPIK